MCYKCHRVNFIGGGSYIDSPEQIKKKKTTINLKNTRDKCFQYAAAVMRKFNRIQKDLQILNRLQINITEME